MFCAAFGVLWDLVRFACVWCFYVDFGVIWGFCVVLLRLWVVWIRVRWLCEVFDTWILGLDFGVVLSSGRLACFELLRYSLCGVCF